jgi:DNA-binding transcriptional ArsR family regulator
VYDAGMAIEYRKIERIAKGFANHNRLRILELLDKSPGLSVLDVSEKIKVGYENASDHIRKMAIVGLLVKHNKGSSVCHKLTNRGKDVLVFCKRLQ